MQRKFLSNMLLLLALNLLVKPLWILGIDRSFQNSIGFEAYGNYANLFVFSLILSVILDLGVNNFVSSTLAKNKEKIHTLFLPLLTVKLIFGMLYILITIALGWWYGYTQATITLLVWLCLNQLLAYLSTFLRSHLSGLQLYQTDAWLSVVDRLVMLIAGIGIFWFQLTPATIHLFIGIQTLGYLSAFLASLWFLRPYLLPLNLRWDSSAIYPILKQAFPFALLSLLMMCYTRADNLLLKKLHSNGDWENGVYAAGGRIFEAANMFAVLISGMLLPAFSATLAQQKPLNGIIKLALMSLPTCAIFVSSFCWFYREPLLHLLYPEANDYSTLVFGVQMLSFIPLCVMYVFGTLLTASHRMKLLTSIAAIALVINTILNVWFVPAHGALASAVAALVTHTFVCITNSYFAIQKHRTGITISDSLKLVAMSLLTGLFIGVAFQLEWSIIPAALLSGMVWVILLFLFRLLDVKNIKALIIGFPKNN